MDRNCNKALGLAHEIAVKNYEYKSMQQVFTFFSHRDPIEKFFQGYLNKIKAGSSPISQDKEPVQGQRFFPACGKKPPAAPGTMGGNSRQLGFGHQDAGHRLLAGEASGGRQNYRRGCQITDKIELVGAVI